MAHVNQLCIFDSQRTFANLVFIVAFGLKFKFVFLNIFVFVSTMSNRCIYRLHYCSATRLVHTFQQV